jgi:hypothetical protein
MMAAGVGLSVARNAAMATSATMVWRTGAGVNVRRAYQCNTGACRQCFMPQPNRLNGVKP